MRILDTDVMIDILSKYVPAKEWLVSLGEEELYIPGFVVMELMQGCRNKREIEGLRKELGRYWTFWPTYADCDRALKDFAQGYLSHGLGIMDALIGQCAVGLDAPLCTFNVKHFKAIGGLTIEQPYSRKVGHE